MDEAAARALAKQMGNECLAVRARILSRVVTSCYERETRALKLKAGQGSILVCVAYAGVIDQAAIGRRLKMEKSTVCRSVERMKASGWLEEVEGDAHHLRLTDAGRELLGQFHQCWLKAQQKALALLGSEGAMELKKLTAPILGR